MSIIINLSNKNQMNVTCQTTSFYMISRSLCPAEQNSKMYLNLSRSICGNALVLIKFLLSSNRFSRLPGSRLSYNYSRVIFYQLHIIICYKYFVIVTVLSIVFYFIISVLFAFVKPRAITFKPPSSLSQRAQFIKSSRPM